MGCAAGGVPKVQEPGAAPLSLRILLCKEEVSSTCSGHRSLLRHGKAFCLVSQGRGGRGMSELRLSPSSDPPPSTSPA